MGELVGAQWQWDREGEEGPEELDCKRRGQVAGHVGHSHRDPATGGDLIDPVGAGVGVDREGERKKAEPEVLDLPAAAAEQHEVMQESESKERGEDELWDLRQ